MSPVPTGGTGVRKCNKVSVYFGKYTKLEKVTRARITITAPSEKKKISISIHLYGLYV